MGTIANASQTPGPRRVLHAASYQGDTAGGVIPMIVRLAREIRECGGAFALVVPRNEAATWHAQVRSAGVELILVDDARGALRVARAWDPEILHVHFYGWEDTLTLGLWFHRTRIFWHIHSAVNRRGRVRRSARSLAKLRLVGARVERFLTVSDAIGSELVSLGAPRDRTSTVRNVVDSNRFRPPSPVQRSEARKTFALRDATTILFFGWEPRRKGADVLFDALADLPGMTVMTVATPGETRSSLAGRATVVAFERVEDVVPLLWAADVLAVPSRAEGFCLVVLEALLAGLPVASSDLPALHEAGGGRTRIRYSKVGDGPELARSIRELLELPTSDTQAGEARDTLGEWAAAVLRVYAHQAAE